MPTPEELARINIDKQLTACGWSVQSRAEMNLSAGRGIAVREFSLSTGEADYLLFVDRGGGGGGGEARRCDAFGENNLAMNLEKQRQITFLYAADPASISGRISA